MRVAGQWKRVELHAETMPPIRRRENAHARQWIISPNEIIFMAMDLRWLPTFVMVAERGSLIGAARQLDVSPPSVTRAIASLEAHVGVQLFTRTTRSVKLTEPGEICRLVIGEQRAGQREQDSKRYGARPERHHGRPRRAPDSR